MNFLQRSQRLIRSTGSTRRSWRDRRLSRGATVVVIAALALTSLAGGVGAIELTLHQTTTGGIDQTPFWLQANRWGLYTDSPVQGALGAEASVDYDFGEHWNVEALLDVDQFVDDDGTATRLRYGYGALQWRAFQVKGGTFPQIIGILPAPELSSGSMSVSGNARPLPTIQFSMPEWTMIPFTNETLEIQGGIAHGWFLGERAQTGALLHEKWGYGRFGPRDGAKLYLGFVHQVTWGGEIQEVGWDNFQRAFLSRDAAADSPERGPAGNTVGMWDLGVEMPMERADLHGYHHHHFELEQGIYWQNALDGLWGLGAELNHETPWPSVFVIESVYTKHQGGKYHSLNQILADAKISEEPENSFGIGAGSHQYYSHSPYLNGWTHQNRIIGTPLVVAVGEDEALRIASNRINAWHIGIGGDFDDERYTYQLKITQATHSPTRIGARRYAPVSLVPEDERYRQWSTFLGMEIDRLFPQENGAVSFGFGADYGDVYANTVGFELGLRWTILSD